MKKSSDNKVPQESSQPLTKYSSNTDISCKADSTNIKNVDKSISKNCFQYVVEGLNYNYLSNRKETDSTNKLIELRTDDEILQFTTPKLRTKIISAVNDVLMKNLPKEALETLNKNSNIVHFENITASLSECKDEMPTIINVSSLNHNNVSTSKNQCNQISITSQRMTNNIQQPSILKHSVSTIQMPPNPSKPAVSSIASPKLPQPTIKPNDQKHLSNNQHGSIKHPMATVTHLQPINKQTMANLQSKSVSVTQLPSINKQLDSQPDGKPAIPCQLSRDAVKRCNKCNVSLSSDDDDVCTTCRMFSQLKGVTVTRIENPDTYVNKDEDSIPVLISSDDEDSSETQAATVEPVITKIESKELIIKHMDKLKYNPKLLEDKLWQKDLGIKDYFKIEHCHTLRIGNYITKPPSSSDIFICLHGIRMTINNREKKAVTIDIQMDNIVKILGHYAESGPMIFIYTNYLAAFGIRYLMNMHESNYYFDPLNKDITLNKIVLYFTGKRNDLQKLEQLLLKLPKGKYELLSLIQANDIQSKLHKKDENNKHQIDNTSTLSSMFENIVIADNILDDRVITKIRISDYRMLSVGEFVNDSIIEFYLNYWYSNRLSTEDRERTYVFNTFFYTSLTKLTDTYKNEEMRSKFRHDRVKKWTKNVNIFEKDFIFIPINENFHWFMAVICFPYLSGPVLMEDGITEVNLPRDDIRPYHSQIEHVNDIRDEADGNTEDLWKFEVCYNVRNGVDYETDIRNWKEKHPISIKQPCILIFDSLTGGTCKAKIAATLREWLFEEYRTKYNGIEKDFSINIMKGGVVKVPQQPNYSDCGLYVMHYFEKFFAYPIVDYTVPIKHLENWFPFDEVSLNCQKRRDVQRIILNIMEEQGHILPAGFKLPTLNFVEDTSKVNVSNTQVEPQQCSFNNRNNNINHNETYYNNEVNLREDMDMHVEEDDDEYLELENEEIEDNGEYQYNDYTVEYNDDEEEEVEEEEEEYLSHENREYGFEMGQNDNWGEETENEYDTEDINEYHNNDILINPSSSNYRNHHSNHQQISTENLRSFRSNLQSHQVDDVYINDENDEEDDQLTHIRKRRRLNHRL